MKEQTGFADVDGSGRSGELVDYLARVALHVGEFWRQGYEFMRLRPGDAVLDVGCGAGEVCVELAAIVGAQGRVAGVDLSEAMVEAARRTVAASGRAVELRPASIYALPFADGAFDAVRAERVFQHLDNPEGALREMMRVAQLVKSFTFDHPQFIQMFFVGERSAAAVAAGEITAQEGADFLAALEQRHRAGTFFSSAIGYTVVGTKPQSVAVAR